MLHTYPHTLQLQTMPFVLAFPLLFITAKASLIVVLDKKSSQRKLYTIAVIGCLCGLIPLVAYLATYSPGLVYSEVASWPARFHSGGWLFVFPVVLAALTPVWLLIDCIHIYRHPPLYNGRNCMQAGVAS